MIERDDQLPKVPVLLGPTTGVRCKREDCKSALDSLAESKEAGVVGRVAAQLALNDVFLEALDVLLERDGGGNPIPAVHPVARLLLAAAAGTTQFGFNVKAIFRSAACRSGVLPGRIPCQP
jgi:hypothetical protein